jgi:hypothetical protein
MRDEMVVIRKHCPRFELPTKLRGHFKQAAFQYNQPLLATKMMLVMQSACRYEVGGSRTELMQRRVWPRHAVGEHGAKLSRLSKPASAFWSAPAERSVDGAFGKPAFTTCSSLLPTRHGVPAGPKFSALSQVQKRRRRSALPPHSKAPICPPPPATSYRTFRWLR